MFKNACVNDSIWSCIHGWGRIIRIDPEYELALTAEFKNRTMTFTTTGRWLPRDLYPQLYWNEFAPPIEAMTPLKRPTWFWLYTSPTGHYKVTKSRHANRATAMAEVEFMKGIILHRIAESESES